MIANLNQFLTIMTDTVFKYEGTLDKYIGDALMVFFNDPLPQEDHATRAVKMALDMQKDMVDPACPPCRDSADGTDSRHRHRHRIRNSWQHRLAQPNGLHGNGQPREPGSETRRRRRPR